MWVKRRGRIISSPDRLVRRQRLRIVAPVAVERQACTMTKELLGIDLPTCQHVRTGKKRALLSKAATNRLLQVRKNSAFTPTLTCSRTRQGGRRPGVAGVRGLLRPVAGAELALRDIPAQRGRSAQSACPLLVLCMAHEVNSTYPAPASTGHMSHSDQHKFSLCHRRKMQHTGPCRPSGRSLRGRRTSLHRCPRTRPIAPRQASP